MRVLAIFESSYGNLENPDLGDAAWLVESPENRSLAKHAWAGAGSGSEVTLFSATPDEPGDTDTMARFDDIDLHHPAWTEIGFVGVRLTETLEHKLLALGVAISSSEAGFVARR